MKRWLLIPTAWLVDQIGGDPEWLPHPVRLMGFAIAKGEKRLRYPHQSNAGELFAGAALTVSVVACSYVVTKLMIRSAKRHSPVGGLMLEGVLAWTCIAAENLHIEAAAVLEALEQGNQPLARARLARIVGRDTYDLDNPEICRAVIETLAESTCDGIVAPIFYMLVGGVPLAMAYKAVNTLDSMIGHANEKYFYFGKAAARLDDGMNYVPARLTAAGLIIASALGKRFDSLTAWKTWRRDGNKHKSPNAGRPESTMAGALKCRLGGENIYDGDVIQTALLGAEFVPPSVQSVRGAMLLVSRTTLIAVVAFSLMAYFAEAAPLKRHYA